MDKELIRQTVIIKEENVSVNIKKKKTKKEAVMPMNGNKGFFSHRESVPLTRKTLAKIALKVAIVDQDFKQFKKNRDLYKRLDEKEEGNLSGSGAKLLNQKLSEDKQGEAILKAIAEADIDQDG